jgi:hypothetical protein
MKKDNTTNVITNVEFNKKKPDEAPTITGFNFVNPSEDIGFDFLMKDLFGFSATSFAVIEPAVSSYRDHTGRVVIEVNGPNPIIRTEYGDIELSVLAKLVEKFKDDL